MSIEKILAQKGRDVVTISPDETLVEAARTLHRRRIGAVIVVDGQGAVLGILSERDLVNAVAESGVAALDSAVSTRMTRQVRSCGPTASVDEIMTLMTEGKFRHVPVLKDGRLAGIISIGDVVKLRLADIEAEHKAMRDYIATA